MSRRRSRLIRATVPNCSSADDKARTICFRLSRTNSNINVSHVHTINRTDSVPAIGTEALGYIFGKRDTSFTLDGYIVSVIEKYDLPKS